MIELEISPDYVRMLALKVGALAGKDAPNFPDAASNPTDDPLAAIEDEPGDQSRREIFTEIGALNETEQAELVALMWLGREDAEPEEWDSLVEQARQRREVPTAHYLLDHPLLSEFWLAGLERLQETGSTTA